MYYSPYFFFLYKRKIYHNFMYVSMLWNRSNINFIIIDTLIQHFILFYAWILCIIDCITLCKVRYLRF